MTGLSTLPADLHQSALLHKNLIKKKKRMHGIKTRHFTDHRIVTDSGHLHGFVYRLNDCMKGNTRVVQGRQGGLANCRQKQCCYRIESYPARLQQVPLPVNTVLYVDQSQQVLLRHKEGKKTERRGEKMKMISVCANMLTFANTC